MARFRHLAAAATVLATATLASAQTSTGTVSYQGVITESGAAVPDGQYTLVFRIYDAAAGGSPVETITVPGVQTTQGRFTAAVPVTPYSFNGADRWWSVTFDGTELPRQKVTAAPYAVSTRGLAVDASGRVGIGTSNPAASLHVDTSAMGGEVRFSKASAGDQTLRMDTGTGGAANQAMVLSRSAGDDLEIGSYFTSYYFRATAGKPMSFGTGSRTDDLIVEAGGDVIVRSKLSTGVLEIRGGSDVAEPFFIAGDTVVPGMVVCIDAANPGGLRLSDTPYDQTVAGAVSGAGGVSAGLVLRHEETLADGDHSVALSGRVYVYCDATFGAIKPGDRLTTSGTPGHAMRVSDEARAPGTVIGKAMTALPEGRGLVLVLVSLQ